MSSVATIPKPLATLIHISDLHFTKSITADERLSTRILACLPAGQGLCGHSYQAARALAIRVGEVLADRARHRVPLCVVVTGDLSRSGGEEEFATAKKFLRGKHVLDEGISCGLDLGGTDNESASKVFLVPGNHDIWRRFWPKDLGAYKRQFWGKFPTVLEIPTPNNRVIVYGMDSTQTTILEGCLARGCVNETELGELLSLIKRNRSETTIQIVCLHHPLCDPANRMIAQENQLANRKSIAWRLADAGADLVLSGHIHDHFVPLDLKDIPFQAIAGTATQQFHARSFFVIDIYHTVMRLILFFCNDRIRSDCLRFTVSEEYLLRFVPKRGGLHGPVIIPMPDKAYRIG